MSKSIRVPPEPILWPEIPAPDTADRDRLCRAVHGARRLVWAEGNPTARIGIVLDNPGLRETREGRPYVCPTRQTLQRALRASGLSVNDVLVLFFFKCRPQGSYDRANAYRLYRPILEEQVDDSQVTRLIGLGNVVAAGMLGPDASVKTLRGQTLSWQGRPLTLSYHPLAAHRRPLLFPLLVSDLQKAVSGLD